MDRRIRVRRGCDLARADRCQGWNDPWLPAPAPAAPGRANDRPATRRGILLSRGIIVAVPALWSATATAQLGEGLLVQPAIPGGFDRGRNISVTERQRTDFDPLGIRVRSFLVQPTLELGVGGTSNTYNEANNPRASALGYIAPAIAATSLWSRHRLQFSARGRFVRYADQSPRNENTWNANLAGRVEFGSFVTIDSQLLAARSVEDFFSGDVAANIAALSRYNTYYGVVRGTYTAGRTRAIVSVDHTDTRYGQIRFQDGSALDLTGRDRGVTRLTGQLDFARTPSVSLFVQTGGARNAFIRPLTPGTADRDSVEYRLIGGMNFDLAGRARGSIGAGYSRRDFDSPTYKSVSGVSVEAKVELFPTDLSTYSLTVRRSIEDSVFSNGNPYFDSRVTLQLDRELRRNLIGNLSASYAKQNYQAAEIRDTNGYQFAAGARYLSTRRFRLDMTVRYSNRSTQGGTMGNRVGELRGQFGIVLQR
ncbi:outer membrane beta-barrel protein [Sphingomonas prati]|uniref:Outer membrane beta-barrel protein n=1 Tax=Sphingomonas prati TaxID=1843237 RepID=A0A7W9F2V8_9SPHN|nr:outer membrane beta-barrel protein [Sphingomonas prati]MBB5729214.1 hypothetical protein [Sphingomonas prati]